MKAVKLERSQPLLPLRGAAMDWQRLPGTVRGVVVELLSRMMVQHARQKSEAVCQWRGHER
jgi:hypothetical protein